MASKFGLAGGIPERRVRPIWDAIDSRQFKNALKLSASLLTKYPNSPYALALKALILERMGKSDEALSVCLNAKEQLYKNDSVLMDDLTLSTLQIVFQRLDHLELATGCYEYACGKFPNNLELMMGLFNCYVREYSFVKQQQTAIKMYKLVGEERFLHWAVCSIQLQVLCDNGGEKLLLLAEGLLKKHVATHSLHEPEALIVYISILEQQAKYGDALEVLGKLGSLIMIEIDRLRIEGRLLARQGDYTAAAKIYQKVLELSPDCWESFLHYLGCLLEDDSSWCNGANSNPTHSQRHADSKFLHLSDEVFDSRISDASTFVQKLKADTSDTVLRCPYLANVEIERLKLLRGNNSEEDLMEALVQYFSRFGHLSCFASDVEAFLLGLSPKNKTKLLEKFMKSSKSISLAPLKVLGQSITLFKIQELIGNMYEFSVGELGHTAVEMSEIYCENLPLSKDLDPQESIHGEELLAMACNVLIQLFWRTRNFGYFVEAIIVLEFGLAIRRYAWQYKILLVHLYSYLGALSLAYERYKALDVKNILLETVSHHILPQMLVSSLWMDINNLLKDYLRFMDDHFRESADLSILAYRHRNYSKVIEFVQFKERLQHSNQYSVARVESLILQLKQNADDIEEEERILENVKCGMPFAELSSDIGSKPLTFNEDWQSRPWWTPTPEQNYLLGPFEGISFFLKEKLIKEREANVRKTIERKSLLPRLIFLSVQSASASLKENFELNNSISDSKISLELKHLLDRHTKMLEFSLSDATELIVGVSEGLKSSMAFGENTIDWLNFAVFLNAWNLSSHEVRKPDADGQGPCTWHVVNSLLNTCILNKIKSLESLTCSMGGNLPNLVQLVTEPLAWHILILQSCVRSSLPSGKKKKKSGSSDHSTSPLSYAVRDSIQSTRSILEKVKNWLDHHINRSEDENLDTILSYVNTDGQDEGPGQVLRIIGNLTSTINELDLGDRISQALKSWNHVETARKIVTGQRRVLSEFLRICESKIKLLGGLQQQMAQV